MRSEWRSPTFGELIEQGVLEIGDGYRAKNDELGGSGLVFLRAGHVTDTHIDFDGVERFVTLDTKRFGPKIACAGDVVVTTKGNSTGRVAFITRHMPAFVYSPHLSYWRSKSDAVLNQGFLRAWSRSNEFSTQLAAMSRSTDMAPYLSLSDQRRLRITLPPVTLQRCIGELGDALDERMDLLRQTNFTLESIARTLFKSWFIDFDPVRAKAEGREPEGMDAETAALFPDAFEDSAVGAIPKGWRVGTLGDVAWNPRSQAKPGQMPASTPYIGLEHMPRKSIALDRMGTAEGLESGKFWFEFQDILFGKLRPYFHKVGIAPCKGVCSTDILVIRPRKPNWLGYVAMHASSDELIAHTTRLSNGARMPRTSWHDVDAYRVVLPHERCVKAFNDIVNPLVDRIFSNMGAMDCLSDLRDTLLPRLISGKLRLPENEAQLNEALA